MAGTQDSIRVEFDDSDITRVLKRLQNLGGEMAPAMLEISEYLHERSREHFDNEQAPDGTPWATLSPETLERKAKKGVPVDQTLHGESLHLRDTIYPFHSDEEAGISTGPGTAAYAATHQFGDDSRNIEARPYFGLSDSDEAEIIAIAEEHLQARMSERGFT